jgi:hypothetical protein
LNVVGKRHTFRIDNGNKSWWPELENELFVWFKQQRQKGACVSDRCFKVQATVIFDEIYRNTTVAIPPFAASNGWLDNFLKRKNLVLRRIELCPIFCFFTSYSIYSEYSVLPNIRPNIRFHRIFGFPEYSVEYSVNTDYKLKN